jgi:hypothetical protein
MVLIDGRKINFIDYSSGCIRQADAGSVYADRLMSSGNVGIHSMEPSILVDPRSIGPYSIGGMDSIGGTKRWPRWPGDDAEYGVI